MGTTFMLPDTVLARLRSGQIGRENVSMPNEEYLALLCGPQVRFFTKVLLVFGGGGDSRSDAADHANVWMELDGPPTSAV